MKKQYRYLRGDVNGGFVDWTVSSLMSESTMAIC